ncbi:MAG: hypothetical protein OES38_04085 [Gammaproteobacteria bacterium]|nr:hypothetical protein [Gammaproteobacteria bacterium]
MIEYHDPRGEIATPVLPYGLAVDLQGSNDPRVAFLANGFPDSENFLVALAEVMSEQLSSLRAEHFNKGNASIAAPDEMLGEIEAGCVAAVAAYGH